MKQAACTNQSPTLGRRFSLLRGHCRLVLEFYLKRNQADCGASAGSLIWPEPPALNIRGIDGDDILQSMRSAAPPTSRFCNSCGAAVVANSNVNVVRES